VVDQSDPWKTDPVLRAELAKLKVRMDARAQRAAAEEARHDSKVNFVDDIYRKRLRKTGRAPYTGPSLNTIQEMSNSASGPSTSTSAEHDEESPAVEDEESTTADDDDGDDSSSPTVDEDSSSTVDDDSSPMVDDDKPAVPLKKPAREDRASAQWRSAEIVAGPSNASKNTLTPAPETPGTNPEYDALDVAKHFSTPRKPQRSSGGGSAAIKPPPRPTWSHETSSDFCCCVLATWKAVTG
jgi:hypothetical protein